MRFLKELHSKSHKQLPLITDIPSKNKINKINDDLSSLNNKLEFAFALVETPTSKIIQNVVKELEMKEAKFSSNILFSQIGILVQTLPRAESIKLLTNAIESNTFFNNFSNLSILLD